MRLYIQWAVGLVHENLYHYGHIIIWKKLKSQSNIAKNPFDSKDQIYHLQTSSAEHNISTNYWSATQWKFSIVATGRRKTFLSLRICLQYLFPDAAISWNVEKWFGVDWLFKLPMPDSLNYVHVSICSLHPVSWIASNFYINLYRPNLLDLIGGKLTYRMRWI
jgi:hypothetical protein